MAGDRYHSFGAFVIHGAGHPANVSGRYAATFGRFGVRVAARYQYSAYTGFSSVRWPLDSLHLYGHDVRGCVRHNICIWISGRNWRYG